MHAASSEWAVSLQLLQDEDVICCMARRSAGFRWLRSFGACGVGLWPVHSTLHQGKAVCDVCKGRWNYDIMGMLGLSRVKLVLVEFSAELIRIRYLLSIVYTVTLFQ